jgi:hypothetical protein
MRSPALPTALAALALVCAGPAGATLTPELGFEALVAESEAIVHGTVVRSWTAWDDERVAIWTHYEVRVADWLKRSAGARSGAVSTLIVSEPGGSLDGVHMRIVGAPSYGVGEEVVVFADRTEIGYLRTCGWSQGKFSVRSEGEGGRKTVASTPTGATIVRAEQQPKTPLSAFQQSGLDSFKTRIRSEVAAGDRR